MYSIGIDTGGTFTDVILINEEGNITVKKVPSTPEHPEEAVINGLVEAGVDTAMIDRFVHGTTVNTNAMITGTGAKTGLVTTEGFRDVLEIRRAHRLADYVNLYNLQQELPKPIVPRRYRKEVGERVLYDGSVLRPLPEDEVRSVAESLMKEGMEAVAVVYIFAYNYPDHEKRTKEIIQEILPNAFVTTSIETDAVFREYERTSTTVINAYLGPHSRTYFSKLGEKVKEKGVNSEVILMGSNGGTLELKSAIEKPVTTILSGLAGGSIGGAFLADLTGRKDVITVDMGGTSCDVCLIHDGIPTVTTEGKIANHSLTIPMIDVHTIGAGGGSIAWIDSGGALRVGPQSAGAEPGPACYGKGGDLPTVTDADLILGYLNPNNFLGGKIILDMEKARDAIKKHIVKPFGFASVEEAAFAIHQIVNSNMSSALRVVSVDKSYDPREFTLVAFGGAGPVHSIDLADSLNIPELLIPRYPGIHSAVGLLVADNQHDFRRSYVAPLDGADLGYIEEIYRELEKEGKERMTKEGIPEEKQEIRRFAEIRYIGQAHEVNLPVQEGEITKSVLDDIKEKFHEAHFNLYSHSSPDAPTMFVTLAVKAIGRTPTPTFQHIEKGTGKPNSIEMRPVYFGEYKKYVDTPVYSRKELLASQKIEGPAIIEQMDSTTLILPNHEATVDHVGSLTIHKS
ncbi:MAG: hydantoinase/oxoprolinase family protein [Desulfobacteraceae bacterium]|nr:hydantoinase/oxoprolinase family protein [Desulfobacteraceae bacterium]